MTFRLDYYDAADLAVIVRRSARILDVEIADDAADEIAGARAARRGSRTASSAASATSRRCGTPGEITTEIAAEALELHEVDEIGLERIDRELLRAIAVKFGGGPVGLSTLAVTLGEEPETIEDVYEPYLLQLGFIQRTPRGRTITALGRDHVGVAAERDGSLFEGLPRSAEPAAGRCRAGALAAGAMAGGLPAVWPWSARALAGCPCSERDCPVRT